ncbi:MAG: hypothetical protein K2K49_05405 [Duncaniella sp.]|nr:hypothetical protein [Duncaniella sp.]
MQKKFLYLALLTSMAASAQNIDFDFPGRNTSEVTEPNYIAWPVGRVATETKTLDGGVSITLSAAEKADGLGSNWNKQSVQSGMKLLGDGVLACNLVDGNMVKLTDGPTALVLTIKGLAPGHHSLLAYHHNTDKNQVLPPVNVEVNGEIKVRGALYSTNKDGFKNSEAGTSYVEFEAVAGEPVVIRYITDPQAGVTYSTTSVMLCGLEFDTAPYGITDGYPENHDFHAAADDGRLTLTWKGADVAVSHKLVLGTDSTEVADAVRYQYEGTDPRYTAGGLSPLEQYWWRVDEVEADGTVHTGKVMTFRTRRDAFPGAEGYGRYAIGGRGGSVYHVTSLEDDAETPGTLRYGIEKLSGPRTIVFDVAGLITLKSRLVVSDKFVTIAGQTAPGKGILLRGKAFGMQSDGITRFMRLYLGGADDWNDKMGGNPNTSDGMGMTGNDHSIMDHCSIAWTIDEGFSSRGAKTMTLQRTMISEALNYAGHATQYEQRGKHVSHGYAATIGGGEMGSLVGSYHHNFLAHCEGRNWSLSGGLDGAGNYDGHHDVFNNVVYNWGGRATDGGTHQLNFVNNYYKEGPATTQSFLLRHQFEGVGKGTQSAYVSGNIRENLNGSLTADREGDTYRYELSNGQVLDWEPWSKEPFFPSNATVETAEAAFRNVLSDVGCNMPLILNHDSRVIREALNGTTSTTGRYTGKKGLPDCESDAGGYASLDIETSSHPDGWDTDRDGIPDWFEALADTDPAVPNNNDDRDRDHYTDLEEYLAWVALPNFNLTGAIEIPLSGYFAGYTAPVYAVDESPAGMTASISGGTLTLTPTPSARRLSTLSVRATQDGVTLVRKFNIAYPAGVSGLLDLPADETEPDTTLYDLLGRKVTNPTPGLYLRKGSKVIIR